MSTLEALSYFTFCYEKSRKLDVQNVEREASKSDYANGTRAAAATRFHFNLRVFVLRRSSHTMTSAELR